MDRIHVLYLVNAEGIGVLHNAPGVNQALSVGWDILEIGTGQLCLEVQHSRRLGYGECVCLVIGALDFEGDLGIVARLAGFSHGKAAKQTWVGVVWRLLRLR